LLGSMTVSRRELCEIAERTASSRRTWCSVRAGFDSQLINQQVFGCFGQGSTLKPSGTIVFLFPICPNLGAICGPCAPSVQTNELHLYWEGYQFCF
jgi:hypothetical protein